jgi:nitroreductase
MLARKSIRKYTDEVPSDEVIETIVRAGQQAAFAAQLGSVLLSRERKRHPFAAPLNFVICVDAHRLERVMERRGWKMVSNDLSLLLFGIQDACYMAENMVNAAEAMGLGSCFIGRTPYRATKVIERFKLPPRVFPLVELVMGYPAEDPPPRPRYPLIAHLHDGQYHAMSEDELTLAMREMDDGYLAQDYYRRAKYMVPLEGEREETFTYDDYSWTEHMGRKWGQWLGSPDELLKEMEACGFRVGPTTGGENGEAVGFGGSSHDPNED